MLEPETAAKLIALRQEVIATGQQRCTELAWDVAGERRTFDMVVMPLRDASGWISGITNVAIDITDRMAERHAARELEERFRAAQESALDAFMVVRALRDPQDRIIDFVWDYINPAGAQMMRLERSAIVGQRLLSAFPGQRDHPEQFPSYVAVAETGGARRLTRIEVGRVVYRAEPLKLQEFLHGIVEDYQLEAKRRGLTLWLLAPSVTIELVADRGRLQQIFANCCKTP